MVWLINFIFHNIDSEFKVECADNKDVCGSSRLRQSAFLGIVRNQNLHITDINIPESGIR